MGRMPEVPACAGGSSEEGGLILGPIWPRLASFTPSGEAGNEATVALFGPPITRTRWASRPWLWPWLASSGVARSGETFNSVAFGCISWHSYGAYIRVDTRGVRYVADEPVDVGDRDGRAGSYPDRVDVQLPKPGRIVHGHKSRSNHPPAKKSPKISSRTHRGGRISPRNM